MTDPFTRRRGALGILAAGVLLVAAMTACTNEEDRGARGGMPEVWRPDPGQGSPVSSSPTTARTPVSIGPATSGPELVMSPEPVKAGTEPACPSETYAHEVHRQICALVTETPIGNAGGAEGFCEQVAQLPYVLVDRRLWTDTASVAAANRFLAALVPLAPTGVAETNQELALVAADLQETLEQRDKGEVSAAEVQAHLAAMDLEHPALVITWYEQVAGTCGVDVTDRP